MRFVDKNNKKYFKFNFFGQNHNYGIVLESSFIIIVVIVLYCTNPLRKNDIYYLLHLLIKLG